MNFPGAERFDSIFDAEDSSAAQQKDMENLEREVHEALCICRNKGVPKEYLDVLQTATGVKI